MKLRRLPITLVFLGLILSGLLAFECLAHLLYPFLGRYYIERDEEKAFQLFWQIQKNFVQFGVLPLVALILSPTLTSRLNHKFFPPRPLAIGGRSFMGFPLEFLMFAMIWFPFFALAGYRYAEVADKHQELLRRYVHGEPLVQLAETVGSNEITFE